MDRLGRVLITGFEPFGGDTRNVSGQVALALNGARVGGHVVHGRVLPCAFEAAPAALQRAIGACRPARLRAPRTPMLNRTVDQTSYLPVFSL